MLRKQSFCRPKTNQLVLSPYLVPFIIRIYLNLGRVLNTANKDNKNFNSEIFLKFLKAQKTFLV